MTGHSVEKANKLRKKQTNSGERGPWLRYCCFDSIIQYVAISEASPPCALGLAFKHQQPAHDVSKPDYYQATEQMQTMYVIGIVIYELIIVTRRSFIARINLIAPALATTYQNAIDFDRSECNRQRSFCVRALAATPQFGFGCLLMTMRVCRNRIRVIYTVCHSCRFAICSGERVAFVDWAVRFYADAPCLDVCRTRFQHPQSTHSIGGKLHICED